MSLSYHDLQKNVNGLKKIQQLAKDHGFDEIKKYWEIADLKADIIYGLSLGRHVAEVNKLLSEVKDSEDPRQLKQNAAKGFAEAGIVEQIISYHESNPAIFDSSLIAGLAKAGRHLDITRYRTEWNDAEDRTKAAKLRSNTVEGLAAGGHRLLLWNEYTIERENYLGKAIQSAATAGQVDIVNAILVDANINLTADDFTPTSAQLNLIQRALTGYSKGRHFEQLEPLLHLGAKPELALHAIANGFTIDPSDYTALVEKISDAKLNSDMVAALNRHFDIDLAPAAESSPSI